VLKGSTSPFEFLKVILTQNIETIRDLGRADQAASLKLIVEDLKKDVGEWRRLNSTDLTPFVEEEVKRLSEHMQRGATCIRSRVSGVEIPEAEKIKITDAINASNNALGDANE